MARKAAAAAPAKKSIGEQIDEIFEEREVLRTMNAEVKKVEEGIKAREQALLDEMTELNLEGARGTKASIAVTKSTSAQVEDWETFWPWIAKTKNFHLIVKRVNDASYREQLTLLKGKAPPGTMPFEKTKLSLRTV